MPSKYAKKPQEAAPQKIRPPKVIGRGFRATVMVPVADLKPADYNPRQATAEQCTQVADSIRKFGFVDPVIVNSAPKRKNVVIGGHLRLRVAKDLGMAEVPVAYVDLPLERDERELNLRLNKNTGEWDWDKLMEFDRDLLADVGFDNKEISKLVDGSEAEEDDFDVAGALGDGKPARTKLGDIWQLGRHRLMCGDSTLKEHIERLMDGKKANMVFTDPPYALFGNSTGVVGVADDKMIRPFFRDIFRFCASEVVPFGHIYTCCDWHGVHVLRDEATAAGLALKNLCVWDKGDGGIGGMYQNCHELVWFIANTPQTNCSTARKTGERTINGKPNIWRYSRTSGDEKKHNAAKPVAMVQAAIENSCDEGGLALDFFGGSGTTLMACEQTNRICYMMEIDPKYCDVIIKRWEQLTGEKAVKCKDESV